MSSDKPLSLLPLLERCRSTSLKDRKAALVELSKKFRAYGSNSSHFQCKTAEYLDVFNQIFRCAIDEHATYSKAKTDKTRTIVEERLVLVSEALRFAIEACLHFMGYIVVTAILDHVLQLLMPTSGELCEPLAIEYSKCVRIILSYPPHVEHLNTAANSAREAKNNDWTMIADFCIGSVEQMVGESADGEFAAAAGSESVAVRSSNYSSYRGMIASQSDRLLIRQVAEDMIVCLQFLTGVPNAPVLTKAQDITRVLICWLQSSSSSGRQRLPAFVAIKQLLMRVRTEDTKLTEALTYDLVLIIRKSWPSSTSGNSALREEMLKILLLLRPYFFVLSDQSQSGVFRRELQALLLAIESEYATRKGSKVHLSSDDLRCELTLRSEDHRTKVASLLFSLQSQGADHNWILLCTLATVYAALGKTSAEESVDRRDSEDLIGDSDGPPRSKRQRRSDEFGDLLARTTTGELVSRISALQTLTFYSEQYPLPPSQVSSCLEKLQETCAENSGPVNCWSFFALASLATQDCSANSELAQQWNTVWQLAVRALTDSQSCRAAAYSLYVMFALNLVTRAGVNELVQTMTNTVDLTGPALLADSVSLLLPIVVKQSQESGTDLSLRTTNSIAGWFSRVYTPSRFMERTTSSDNNSSKTADVMSLICSCLGQKAHLRHTIAFPLWDTTTSVWIRCVSEKDLVSYLLLSPTDDRTRARQAFNDLLACPINTSTARVNSQTSILTHLITELTRINEIWQMPTDEKIRLTSSSSLAQICRFCCVIVCSAFCCAFRDVRRQSELQKQARLLLEAICEVMSSIQCPRATVDILLVEFSSVLSGVQDRDEDRTSGHLHCLFECEKIICAQLSEALDARQISEDNLGDEDQMDIEIMAESQESRAGKSNASTTENWLGLDTPFCLISMRYGVALYAKAVVLIQQQQDSIDENFSAASLISDYILDQPPEAILACSGPIAILPSLGMLFSTEDTKRVLERFVANQRYYAFVRSEVAIGSLVDIISSFKMIWSSQDDEELYNLGLDVYDWCASIIRVSGVLSPASQKRLAAFLLDLCQTHPDYVKGMDMPSPRTCLFSLIQRGCIGVQHFLTSRVPAMFSKFTLAAHDAMFDDLQSSLPAEAEWIEGIAMRLLYLSELASAWHSLLRRCVYYLFETAGRVQKSLKHATWCINNLARSLPLKMPQKLFSTFAPQLLHTWLESSQLSELPFAAFQYVSLNELLVANESEVCAQLMMRNAVDDWTVMSKALKMLPNDIIKKSFAKSLAYAIGRDISRPQQNAAESVEQKLRDAVGGKETYRALISQVFPTTMSYLYLCMQQDDFQDSWLEKRPAFTKAFEALKKMKDFSHSVRVLPPSQQPSFRSKYLCDQIERLCRRVGADPTKPWNPSSFMLAARMLIDTVEPSLGPLHACLVIRRLRVLIAMAGDVACTGLPLEMLIHFLRSFVSDSECADDTLGILRYLFDHGIDHLRSTPKFFIGAVILLILRMRQHSRQEQESTTLESQHRSTIERMLQFQGWLVDLLTRNIGDILDHADFTGALALLRLPGNSCKGSAESRLLVFLLQQWSFPTLCSEWDASEAVSILSEQFEISLSTDQDCLGDDTLAIQYSPQLFDIALNVTLGDTFLAWLACVLGRAYAASGKVPRVKQQSELHTAVAPPKPPRPEDAANSVSMIASRLTRLIYSRKQSEAGLAEFTLRTITKSISDATELLAFEQVLPEIIQLAIQGGTFKYEPKDVSDSTILGASYTAKSIQQAFEPSSSETIEVWATAVAVAICTEALNIPVVNSMVPICANVPGLALEILPFLIHILLTRELGKKPIIRGILSKAAMLHFKEEDPAFQPKQCFFLKLLLYLRSQPMPSESTQVDRLQWLEVDLQLAASAGVRCGMHAAALLFAESISPLPQPNRRTSARSTGYSEQELSILPDKLLLEIFSKLEEPDSFYGVKQEATLDAVLGRLDYEKNGTGSLMVRAAQMDSRMQTTHQLIPSDVDGLVHSLSALNLKSLTYILVNNGLASSTASSDAMLDAARSLQQWDVNRLETNVRPEAIIYDAFQELSQSSSIDHLRDKVRNAVKSTAKYGVELARSALISQSWFRSLAVLSEFTELLSVADESEMASLLKTVRSRQEWMQTGQYEDVHAILSSRETALAVLAENGKLGHSMHVGRKGVLKLQVEALLDVSKFAREQSRLQEAMTATASLSDIVSKCRDSELSVSVAAQAETAYVLWKAGEATTSIQILRTVLDTTDFELQDIPIGRPSLLAQLGHQLAEARLEKPEDILQLYLQPAINQLENRREGAEAGQVYHEFATFCHNELQSHSNSENFLRVEKLRNRKMDEVTELKAGIENSKKGSREREDYERSLRKANQWFAIDDAEYQRLKQTRDMHIRQSLQNYLLTLQASDKYDASVLRFFTLWLENSEDLSSGDSIAKHLPNVPSWKFVLLMNQLMSSLEHNTSTFQNTLRALVLRICSEHPHHGLHHLFASSRRPEGSDTAARSRYSAAKSIASEIQKTPRAGSILRHVFAANKDYDDLACSGKLDKGRTREAVKNFAPATKVATNIPRLQVPPATITLATRPSCDYGDVPIVIRFSPSFDIMSGLSAPKALKATASDGRVYKQLFKSGNDDLRQDAIMEQVFEGVSKMLRNHRATRQRDLKVRTYKVIPLSTNSGIIEFVPNSIPINEFLRPAHKKYHPKDWSDSKARDDIRHAQQDATATRVQVFRKICQNMRPVLRHFFLERFNDPDEWFERRTAYTRTTASVSMLGHVLGLGDRHCHNILLDEGTGEIVHIDLGVAFEAGRVLPIPELVPFRLTRDIVDGMGITKTEGVFRRCCEFTMDALREDKSSIMTLLNVLRYDPLYNWTVSPLRAKHMQDAQETGQDIAGSSRKKGDEAGEADRALSVVEKKLSKTLSTAATVNELIQQATDERNLATLFCGWAAYF